MVPQRALPMYPFTTLSRSGHYGSESAFSLGTLVEVRAFLNLLPAPLVYPRHWSTRVVLDSKPKHL
jgi:hypothetical protein